MARTAITTAAIRNLVPQHTTVGAGDADIDVEAGDDANGNETDCAGGDLVIVENTDASPQTVTFTAAPDEIGRAGAITDYSLAAGAVAIFGPFTTAGWRQNDGKLYIDVSDPLVFVGVLRA